MPCSHLKTKICISCAGEENTGLEMLGDGHHHSAWLLNNFGELRSAISKHGTHAEGTVPGIEACARTWLLW